MFLELIALPTHLRWTKRGRSEGKGEGRWKRGKGREWRGGKRYGEVKLERKKEGRFEEKKWDDCVPPP